MPSRLERDLQTLLNQAEARLAEQAARIRALEAELTRLQADAAPVEPLDAVATAAKESINGR